MSRRLVVVGLVALLIVSVLAGLAPSLAHTPAAAPARVTPAVSVTKNSASPDLGLIEIYTLSAYGYFESEFAPGVPYGEIFFWVYDSNVADLRANITVNDYNSTRDGVTNPAFSGFVTFTATDRYNDTYDTTGLHYTLPTTLPYASTWNVTVDAPGAGFAFYNFTVVVYQTGLGSNPGDGSGVLPGEVVNLTWLVYNTYNDAPWTSYSNLTLWGGYTANGVASWLFTPSHVTLPVSANGAYSFTVPRNASSLTDLWFSISATTWYNGVLIENETSTIYLYVGTVGFWDVFLAATPGCPQSSGSPGGFASGAPIYVCAQVYIAWYDGENEGNAPNVPVDITIANGTKNVSLSGVPTELTTNAQGLIAFSFTPSVPTFQTYSTWPYENWVRLVADYTATATSMQLWKAWDNETFTLNGNGATGLVGVSLSSSAYVAGDTAVATWTISTSDEAITGPLTAAWWIAQDYDTDAYIGAGQISTGGSTGTFDVTVPTWMAAGDSMEIEVYATNATELFEGAAYALITAPSIVLSTPTNYYSPGGLIQVGVTGVGQLLTSMPLDYSVIAEYGVTTNYYPYYAVTSSAQVGSGTVSSGGSVSYTVPTTATPVAVEVNVVGQTAADGIIASATTDLYESTGFIVQATVTTPSHYSDGSYQPGQTITIAYSLVPLGSTPVPASYTIYVGWEDYPGYTTVVGTSSSGSATLTIPSSASSGVQYIYVEIFGAGLTGYDCYESYCDGYTSVNVNPSPSALSYELGANSGITVGWLILFLLIIVVAIVLLLVARRRRSSPPMGGMAVTQPMSPAAPPPSGPPASEWKEPASPPPPASGDAGQPPLPAPPPGAQ